MRRISVSPYITLCAVVFTMRRISASAHVTLCTMVFTIRRISVSAHITLCAVVFTMRRITVSAYITLCAVIFTIRRISVSAHSTLTFHSIPIDAISQSISYVTKYTDCSVLRNRKTHTLLNGAVLYFLISHSNKHRLHIFSHSVLWFSLRDVYRYQPISHSSCRFSTMYGSLVYVWLDRVRKYKPCSFFRAICKNTAHVQWIRCSPKGSHLIHWTSVVFSHIALK